MKGYRPGVTQFAGEIHPDLPAHVGPSFAEAVVLTQVGRCFFLDHAVEQCRAPWVTLERVSGFVFATVTKFGIAPYHRFQHSAADHHKAGSGVTCLYEALAHD